MDFPSILVRHVQRFFSQPIHDYVDALGVCFRRGQVQALLIAVLAFLASWWVYVPIHELSHAYGCMLAGGTVTRLEIAPIYGAAWLQRFFPFVSVGSDYAGRLTGFDTHGSDWIYLITDLAPFVWTVLVGVPLLRTVSGATVAQQVKFGAALPVAFAPFISLIGDYYEMGSILVSKLAVSLGAAVPLERWRSDDIFRLVDELGAKGGIGLGDGVGIGAGVLLGTVLAFATYRLGVLCSDVLFRRSRGPY